MVDLFGTQPWSFILLAYSCEKGGVFPKEGSEFQFLLRLIKEENERKAETLTCF